MLGGVWLKRYLLKFIDYFKQNGIKNTIKRVFFHIKFKAKSEIIPNKKNLYKIKIKHKKNIVFKSRKRAFIITENPFYYNDGKNHGAYYSLILNEMGYLVYYYYDNSKIRNNHGLIPPTINHEIIHKELNIKFQQNDILILEKKMKKCIKTKMPSKTMIIDNNNIKLKQQENDIYNKIIKLINDNSKCSDEFYNNLSIIVLNYNNKKIIDKCIGSLLRFNKKYNYEIIVVDNQSSDGSYEEIVKKYKDKIKIIRNSKNGCASGRNLGVSISEKKYIMFLDSDQWVLNEFWLDNYFEILQKNSKIGAIGWTAGWFNKKGFAEQIVDNFPYRYMPPNGLYRFDIGYLGTGGMILTRELFNNIGGFDINYDPTCYEDTDISLKIRNASKEIVYCPYLGIKHLPHQTTKSGTSSHAQLIKEKGEYFRNKWFRKNKRLLSEKKYIK